MKLPTLHPDCLPLLAAHPVVLALSGGRDSVALLRLLLAAGADVRACHVEHGIRGEASRADARWCRALCERLGVPFEEYGYDVPALARQRHESSETAARRVRREALTACAEKNGTALIALAHHADDQAETVLFRLARGAAGARGMQPVHRSQGLLWLRPLLEQPRAVLTTYLQSLGQEWREDATNAVADVARNRLRLEVLPALNRAMGREVGPILCRSAQQQGEALAALEEALRRLPLTDPQGRLFLPALEGAAPAFVRAVLQRYLRLAGVPDLSAAHLRAVEAILPVAAPSARVSLPGGYTASRRARRLTLLTAEGTPCTVRWGEEL